VCYLGLLQGVSSVVGAVPPTTLDTPCNKPR